MEVSPIALFVYNRPEHTKRTLDSLEMLNMIGESKLYIFSDGPKVNATEEELSSVEKVRKIISGVDFADEVIVTHSEKNQGLSNSIVGGVSKVLIDYESIIVLEDDLIFGKEFLTFMNAGLMQYKDQQKVMHISGYMPPIKGDHPDVALINLTHSWGWGTWRRAWEHYIPDTSYLLNEIESKGLGRKFNYDGSFNFTRLLRRTLHGKRDSWAVRWYASVFLQNGLSLNATKSLVQNIGHDSSGTHSYTTGSFDSELNDSNLNLSLTQISEHKGVRIALRNFYLKQKLKDGPSYYWQQLMNLLRR